MIDDTTHDGLAILRLDNPPVNAMNFAVLDELRAAVRRAGAAPGVRAIVITGGPRHFSAGADLALFRAIHSDEDARRVCRVFQEVFQEIEDSPKPVVAAVAGHVLGGALELAMACHFRVAVAGSRFALPEVRLGINPGAGGTQRLPRLIGPAAAVEMLLTGQSIDAAKALSLGLIDAVCPAEELLATAANVSLQLRCATSLHADKIADAEANRAAGAHAESLAAAGHPEILAPRKIVEAFRIGLEQSFAAGLVAEQEAFAQCLATLAAQNKIYLFFASRQTVKNSSDPFSGAAGVLGMGTMGTGIAQALVQAGVPVTACDTSQPALERARHKIESSLAGRAAQGKMSPQKAQEAAGLLATTTDLGQIARASLVVEAVFEDVALKRDALRRLEEVCPPQTLLATNTSTISLDLLAEGMRHPERLVGLHFFHPAQRMPLVEVVRREATPPDVVARAVGVVKRLGKTPVVVRSREGFVVSRLFVPYLKEAFFLLEEGVDPAAVDRAAVAFGFAMGPLALIDMSGLDILVLTDEVLRRAFPRHGPLSPIAGRLVAAGQLGQKSGGGVYRYEKGDYTPRTSETAQAIIEAVRRERPAAAPPPDDSEIARRLVLRMVNEAFYVLEEEVAQRGEDIDVAMVLGTGLADFRGGPVKYAQDLGRDRVLGELDELALRHGPRYAPCDYLRNWKGL